MTGALDRRSIRFDDVEFSAFHAAWLAVVEARAKGVTDCDTIVGYALGYAEHDKRVTEEHIWKSLHLRLRDVVHIKPVEITAHLGDKPDRNAMTKQASQSEKTTPILGSKGGYLGPLRGFSLRAGPASRKTGAYKSFC